jgi:hypothetical protein
MPRKVHVASALLAFGIISALCGCPAVDNPDGTGRLRVAVTDKPFPFEYIRSAKLTITQVDVRAVEATDDPNADPNDPNEPNSPAASGGFVTIFRGTREFDLVELRNGRTDLLADANVPAGEYDQMRLVVTKGIVTLTDGRTFDLRVPSGSSSGIKLHFLFTVTDGEETPLLLDVDLSRAFRPVPAGKIDDPSTIREFQFQPSVAMRLISILAAAKISGTVTAAEQPVAGAAVTAFDGTTEVTSTATEADGAYTLVGLPTGAYRIEVSAAGYQDASLPIIEVAAGQEKTGVDFALTAE